MTTDPAARLSSLISPLRRALLRAARSAEHLPDIPDAQIEVLRALPPGVTRSSGELAGELGLGRSTVSNLLRSMEAAGLISRWNPRDDRRRVEVEASDRAIDLLSRFDRASTAITTAALERMSDADRAAIARAVDALEHLRDVVQDVSHHNATAQPKEH